MARLRDIAAACKSKNAGPFELTLDIMFADEATFLRVRRSRCLTPEIIGRLYGVAAEAVLFTEYAPAFAYKATIRRRIASGDIGDTDVYGAQQHAPLLDIELPASVA